jgi:CRISPR-associated protein Cas5d
MNFKPDSPLFAVRVRGEIACFTRPEMKVERVSYEVITPSAARGVLEAILWKPAIAWVVRRIHVLAPVRWISFKRNEVTSKIPTGSIRSAMRGGSPAPSLIIEDKRAQRHTLALRDVDYVIEAGFRMVPEQAGAEDSIVKFTEMFRRRLEKGQCFRTPYLGCREFVARVEPAPEDFTNLRRIPNEEANRDLGLMLHDIEFRAAADNLPHFFQARMERGAIEVPPLVPGLHGTGGAS